MGYDTLYFNTSRKVELLRTAKKEERIILTRDRKLALSNPDVVVLIESEGTLPQLKEIISKLSLKPSEKDLFNRCSICNAVLETKEKEEVKTFIHEYVYSTRDIFAQCPFCKRIYWEGDHCKDIRKTLEKIIK